MVRCRAVRHDYLCCILCDGFGKYSLAAGRILLTRRYICYLCPLIPRVLIVLSQSVELDRRLPRQLIGLPTYSSEPHTSRSWTRSRLQARLGSMPVFVSSGLSSLCSASPKRRDSVSRRCVWCSGMVSVSEKASGCACRSLARRKEERSGSRIAARRHEAQSVCMPSRVAKVLWMLNDVAMYTRIYLEYYS